MEPVDDGEMEEVQEDGMDENADEDEGPVAEFVKKEYVAQPYESKYGIDKEIENEKVINSR